jgi:hypothetical protein
VERPGLGLERTFTVSTVPDDSSRKAVDSDLRRARRVLE